MSSFSEVVHGDAVTFPSIHLFLTFIPQIEGEMDGQPLFESFAAFPGLSNSLDRSLRHQQLLLQLSWCRTTQALSLIVI